MKQALERSGYDERTVGGRDLADLRWLCLRHVAGLAAKDAGYGKEFKETLEGHGIKWYHLVPEPREWVRSAKKEPIVNWIVKKTRKSWVLHRYLR